MSRIYLGLAVAKRSLEAYFLLPEFECEDEADPVDTQQALCYTHPEGTLPVLPEVNAWASSSSSCTRSTSSWR
jgi:hypothetical protein